MVYTRTFRVPVPAEEKSPKELLYPWKECLKPFSYYNVSKAVTNMFKILNLEKNKRDFENVIGLPYIQDTPINLDV